MFDKLQAVLSILCHMKKKSFFTPFAAGKVTDNNIYSPQPVLSIVKRSHFIHRLHVQIKSYIVQREKSKRRMRAKEHERKWEQEGGQKRACMISPTFLPSHSPKYRHLNDGGTSEKLIYSSDISLINKQVRKMFYDRSL